LTLPARRQDRAATRKDPEEQSAQPGGARSHRARSVRPLDNGGPYGCRRQGLSDCRDAGISVCRACRTGARRPLAAKRVAGHGAGGEREPRPGCHRGSRMGSRMAGTSAGCTGTPGHPGSGIRTLARDHPAGTRPRNVAVKQSCAVPVAEAQEAAAARRVRTPVPPSR
jgi:hypothetical protein